MNSFAAIASLLAASAFASTANADNQRPAETAPAQVISSTKHPASK